MKTAFIVFISIIINSSLVADTIVTKYGTYQGRILRVTKNSVDFETSEKTITLDKKQILNYTFSTSDMIYFKNGKTVNCKIIGISKGYVVFVSSSRTAKVNMNNLIKKDYNIGPELQVRSLPFTINGFIPTPHLTNQDKYSRFFYLKLPILGLINSSLKNWRNQFVTENGIHPDSKGYLIGGEIGFSLSRFLSLGAGYEYFFHPQIALIDNSTSNKGEDLLSYSFPYASVKFNIIQRTNFDIYFNGNFGLLQAIEKLNNPQGVTTSLVGNTFAGRIKIALVFPFSDNVNGFIEIGYLSAKIKDVKTDEQILPEYNLDFNGFSFFGGLNFIIHF